MKKAIDYAKYFIRRGLDSYPNTFDGNMKLQKLLVFADLINMAKGNGPLFDDPIYAFKNGCVVENVRQRYKYDYEGLAKEAGTYEEDFSKSDQDSIDLTAALLGELSAKELSDLNHQFMFWKRNYDKGTTGTGYHNKLQSIVTQDEMQKELSSINDMLDAYSERNPDDHVELINGIKFLYNPDNITLTDDIVDILETLSENADEPAYNVYMDDGELVVY